MRCRVLRIAFVQTALVAGVLAQESVAKQVETLADAARTAIAAKDAAAAKQSLREALDLLQENDPDCRSSDLWWPRFRVGQEAFGLDLDIGQSAWEGIVRYFDQSPAAASEYLVQCQRAREQLAGVLEQQQSEAARSRAIELRRKIVAAWEKADETTEASVQQAYLGQAMVQSGKADLGLQGLAEFEASLAKVSGDKPTDGWARVAHLYTVAMVDMGRILDDRVARLQEQLLAFYREHPPQDPGDLVDLLWESANVLQERGQLMVARRLAEDSLDRAVKAFGADDIATFYPRAFYGNLLKNQGDLELAELLCKANCKLCDTVELPAQHTTRMRAWNNLGHTYLVQGRHANAVLAFEQGKAARDPGNTDPHVANNLAFAYDNLGECYAELRKFDEAKALLDSALAMDLGLVQRAMIEGGMAIVLQRAGELEAARDRFARSIDTVVQTQRHRQPVNYLRRQALILHALGDGAALTKCLEQLLVVARHTLGECHTLPGRPSYRLATVADDAARTVLSLADKTPQPHDLERQAFEVLESLRGIELRTTHLATQLAAKPEFTQQRDEAWAARAELGKLAALGKGDTAELIELARERERVEFELLFAAYEKLASQPVLLTVDGLAAKLPKGAAIVAYRVLPIIRPDPARRGFDREELRFEAHLLTKEAKGGGRFQRVDLGPAAEIQTLAEKWRQAIQGGEVRGRGAKATGPDPAAELSHKIFKPLNDKLGKNKILITCLDDVLCTVPIELMPDAEKEGYEFRFTVSLTELVRTPSAAAADSLLAVGGIDFDTRPGHVAEAAAPATTASAEDVRGLADEAKVTDAPFDPLKASKDESDNALRHFKARFGKDGVPLTGTDVSRTSFRDAVQHKRFVHIATHGYFTRQSENTARYETVSRLAPMSLCGLALSGANATDQDFLGVITGEDIAALDLSGCELAVLSACETVEGTSRAGHGLASLQGAFHAAGARFVVATRWKIPDALSKDLMSIFYAQLWHQKEPKTPRQALRHAQEQLRAKKVPVESWAGFVLTGDPR